MNVVSVLKMFLLWLNEGNENSGNHGHSGREGKVGGSSSAGAKIDISKVEGLSQVWSWDDAMSVGNTLIAGGYPADRYEKGDRFQVAKVIDNKVVSTAGVKINGSNYATVSGVYTDKAMRGMGLAKEMYLDILTHLGGKFEIQPENQQSDDGKALWASIRKDPRFRQTPSGGVLRSDNG